VVLEKKNLFPCGDFDSVLDSAWTIGEMKSFVQHIGLTGAVMMKRTEYVQKQGDIVKYIYAMSVNALRRS